MMEMDFAHLPDEILRDGFLAFGGVGVCRAVIRRLRRGVSRTVRFAVAGILGEHVAERREGAEQIRFVAKRERVGFRLVFFESAGITQRRAENGAQCERQET